MIGMGGVGQRHARNLRAILGQELRLSAYRTRRTAPVVNERMRVEQGIDIASRYDVTEFFDLEKALRERPDAVVISNPTSLHVPAAMAAARSGCHVFLEKPIAHTLEGVGELLDLVDRKRVVVLVGQQLRFHPLLLRLEEILNEGRIGRVTGVRADFGEYLPSWHPYEDYRGSYAARREMGGGVMLSQIHDFDYLVWLFGLPRRVFCLGGKLSDLEVDVEDTASTLMECRYRGLSIPVHLHQDFLRRVPRRSCHVIGDAGEVTVDLAGQTLCVVNADGAVERDDRFAGFQRNQLFIDEMKHFLDCVAGRAAPKVTLRDGVNVLNVVLAARSSLETGTVCEIPLS